MKANNITVGDRTIDVTSRDVDVLYLSTLKEYLEATHTDMETLIKFITAEIEMLEIAKQHYTKAYRELPYLSDTVAPLGDLLSDIAKLIDNKTAKLKKYKGLL